MILLRALAHLHDAITATRDWCAANVHREPGMVAVTLGAWHVAAVRLDLDECTCGGHEQPIDLDAVPAERWVVRPDAVEAWLRDAHSGTDPAEIMMTLDLAEVGDAVDAEQVDR